MNKHLSSVCAAVILCAGCGGGPEPPPFKPIADTSLVMTGIIEPAADIIWDSVGTIITSAGEENIRPKTEEEWMAVRNAAVTVSESGNLLMMVPRAVDGDEWMRLAQAMVDTGAAAMKAAEAKDPDQVFDAGAEIYAVCTNCHSKYEPDIVRVQ